MIFFDEVKGEKMLVKVPAAGAAPKIVLALTPGSLNILWLPQGPD